MSAEKKKRKYYSWNETSIKLAIKSLRKKPIALNEASRIYGVPKATSKRRLDGKNQKAIEEVQIVGSEGDLPEVLETELRDHIVEMENSLFFITPKDVRELAFQLAEKNKIKNRFNKTKEAAGKKWYYAFMKRNPDISIKIYDYIQKEILILFHLSHLHWTAHTNVSKSNDGNLVVHSRIIDYCGWENLFKDDQTHMPKLYRTKFKTNKIKNTLISILMSLLGILLWISMPCVVLKSPSSIFIELNWKKMYSFVTWLEQHLLMIDRLIIALGVILALVSLDVVIDGIKNTNIKLSPWVEKGKYVETRNVQACCGLKQH